ncbi:hypothetical protein D3C75_1179030 [compost metagenome]
MGSSSLDYANRKISEAFARRTKERAEQQEIQSVKERIQQELLTLADLKAQIAVFQNADNGTATNTKSVNTDNADNTNTLSNDEEQYKATIIQKMVALIQQRKKR